MTVRLGFEKTDLSYLTPGVPTIIFLKIPLIQFHTRTCVSITYYNLIKLVIPVSEDIIWCLGDDLKDPSFCCLNVHIQWAVTFDGQAVM
jgi:hypothetical protein